MESVTRKWPTQMSWQELERSLQKSASTASNPWALGQAAVLLVVPVASGDELALLRRADGLARASVHREHTLRSGVFPTLQLR